VKVGLKTKTMRVEQLHEKDRIEAFLRRDPELHIYSLGDLDDFFWPATTWYGWEQGGQLQEVVLVYAGKALPTVVAISQDPDRMTAFLRETVPLLPNRFHAHLSGGVEAALRDTHALSAPGPHYRMALRDVSRVRDVDGCEVLRLAQRDLGDLLGLYEESYPGNWFDATMLHTGQYFGVRVRDKLVSAAGVHVYSPTYRAAALGNVTTHPDYRNKGYARRVTGRLCQSLLASVDHIGLNVKTSNEIALRCYEKLGPLQRVRRRAPRVESPVRSGQVLTARMREFMASSLCSSSTRPKPAEARSSLYSASVKVPPPSVLTNILTAKSAPAGGDVRDGAITISRITRIPPGVRAV